MTAVWSQQSELLANPDWHKWGDANKDLFEIYQNSLAYQKNAAAMQKMIGK